LIICHQNVTRTECHSPMRSDKNRHLMAHLAYRCYGPLALVSVSV
jgi:hypothetical protein